MKISRSLRSRLLLHCVVFLGFVVTMTLQLRPFEALKPYARHINADYLDGVMNLFSMWWMHEAVWGLKWPYVVPYLHHPMGAKLYWTTLAPIKTVWAAFLMPLFRGDYYGAYAALLFCTSIVSCYTTWLLLRRLVSGIATGWRVNAAAFAGTFVFTLSSYLTCIVARHINLASVEGIPVVILCHLLYKESGKLKYAIAAGFGVFYVGFCDLYYLYYLALFLAADLVYEAMIRNVSVFSRAFWKAVPVARSVGCALVCSLFLLPLTALLLPQLYPPPIDPDYNDYMYGIDPFSLFLPHEFSAWYPYLPEFLRTYISRADAGWGVGMGGLFLGCMTLIIAIFAPVKNLRNARRFASIGGLFLSLSLGSYLFFMGGTSVPVWIPSAIAAIFCFAASRRFPFMSFFGAVFMIAAAYDVVFGIKVAGHVVRLVVPMPYLLFKNIVPFFSRGGYPYRFIVITFLSLAVCFSMTVAYVLEKYRKRRMASVFLAIIFFLVPNMEFMRQPIGAARFPSLPQSIIDRIRSEPSDIAVLGDYSALSQYDVMFHGHPTNFAEISRIPVDEYEAFIKGPWNAFLYRGEGDPSAFNARAILDRLISQGYKYAVFHRPLTVRDEYFERDLKAKQIYKDTNIRAYQLFE